MLIGVHSVSLGSEYKSDVLCYSALWFVESAVRGRLELLTVLGELMFGVTNDKCFPTHTLFLFSSQRMLERMLLFQLKRICVYCELIVTRPWLDIFFTTSLPFKEILSFS